MLKEPHRSCFHWGKLESENLRIASKETHVVNVLLTKHNCHLICCILFIKDSKQNAKSKQLWLTIKNLCVCSQRLQVFIACHTFSYLTECCQYCLSRMRLIILFLSFHSMMHAHWKEILNMSAKFLGIIHSINLIRNFTFVSLFWPMQYLCVLVILL